MKRLSLPGLGFVLFAVASLTGVANSAFAQQYVSSCQPPQPDEYLLLVLSDTRESQEHIQRTLPPDTPAIVCQYLEDTVTRISGFKTLEDAKDWARYVKEIVGLSAFVVRPASTRQSTNSLTYTPQALGNGYAVLVDYLNQPEMALQVKQLLGRDVGLVSYANRPYLLAVYTSSQREANSILRKLSDRGFWSMVVDSRRVTVLRSVVSF